MPRIDEIKEKIKDNIQSKPELAEASSTSVTAIWNLLAYVAAYFSLILEELFIIHKADVDAALRALKPNSDSWYQSKALLFQYGSDLAEGLDTYDNSALTPDQINDQQIVAQAAVTSRDGNVTVKVAKLVDGELTKFSTDQYNAFAAYLEEIKGAGVNAIPLSFEADKLKMGLVVYYNPLILDSEGKRIDGTNDTPVEDALKGFLRNTKFDGLYVRSDHQDTIKRVDGVVVAEINLCQAARFDNQNFSNVDVKYKPYSGFLRLYNDTDFTITYIEWDV